MPLEGQPPTHTAACFNPAPLPSDDPRVEA